MTAKTLQAFLPAFATPLWTRLQGSSVNERLARGAFWSIAGAVASRAIGLCASILVARLLGKERFGELGIVQGTIEMFGTFAGFSMGFTATKHVA